MPYAPAAHFDPSPIERGIASIGLNYAKGVAEAGAKAQEHDYWTQRGRDMAQTVGPDGNPLMSAEQLKKFETSGLGAKKAMVGDMIYNYEKGLQHQARSFSQGMQTEHLNLQKQQLDSAERRFNTVREDNAKEKQLGYEFAAAKARFEGDQAIPREVPGMPGQYFVPKTGATFQYNPNAADPNAEPRLSSDGKFYQTPQGWRPVPQKADALSALLGAPTAAAGAPAAGSPAPGRTPAPSDPFKVGAHYADKNGRVRKYLGNGQWGQ